MIEYFTNVNWLQPSWDLFIVLFFLFAALVYGVALGRDRILVIMVSIYMALAVVNYVPFIAEFSADIAINNAIALKVTVFLGIFILLFFFLSHSALLRTFGSSAEQGRWWQVIIFSLLHVGLLISVVLSFLPADVTQHLSAFTMQFFASDVAKAVWIITPIFAMATLGAGSKD